MSGFVYVCIFVYVHVLWGYACGGRKWIQDFMHTKLMLLTELYPQAYNKIAFWDSKLFNFGEFQFIFFVAYFFGVTFKEPLAKSNSIKIAPMFSLHGLRFLPGVEVRACDSNTWKAEAGAMGLSVTSAIWWACRQT